MIYSKCPSLHASFLLFSYKVHILLLKNETRKYLCKIIKNIIRPTLGLQIILLNISMAIGSRIEYLMCLKGYCQEMYKQGIDEKKSIAIQCFPKQCLGVRPVPQADGFDLREMSMSKGYTPGCDIGKIVARGILGASRAV